MDIIRNCRMDNVRAFEKCLNTIGEMHLTEDEISLIYATVWNALFTEMPDREIDKETGEVFDIEDNPYVQAVMDATMSFAPYGEHPFQHEMVDTMMC